MDIVERLRGDGSSWAQGLFDEAADEIERLRAGVGEVSQDATAEIKRLRAALTKAETIIMIVEPRSHTAEYRAALAEIRAALERSGNAEGE